MDVQPREPRACSAVGVDTEGVTHVPGVVEGASENAEAGETLLRDLVDRGVRPGHLPKDRHAKQLWGLEAHLDEQDPAAEMRKAG
ncbi:MAG: hypothetical protein PVI57_21425 [Gemmatimonadota bacterium]|jgi:hypothetical protein